jgi:hypothetical protein
MLIKIPPTSQRPLPILGKRDRVYGHPTFALNTFLEKMPDDDITCAAAQNTPLLLPLVFSLAAFKRNFTSLLAVTMR